MTSIFELQLLSFDRHIERVERVLRSHSKNKKNMHKKSNKRKDKIKRSQNSAVSISNQTEIKSTNNEQLPAQVPDDKEMEISITFLPPNTCSKAIFLESLKLRQANEYITSQIKDLALQKYEILQKIHKLTQQQKAHIIPQNQGSTPS